VQVEAQRGEAVLAVDDEEAVVRLGQAAVAALPGGAVSLRSILEMNWAMSSSSETRLGAISSPSP
jgi:hypothetical protein